jgi:hypothetical protein
MVTSLFWVSSMLLSTMGGDRCRVDPITYKETKENVMFWEIIEKGGVTPYILKLHGFDS